jgi:hypothetical protein
MGILRLALITVLVAVAPFVSAQTPRQGGELQPIQPEAWQIVVLANRARAEHGAGPLQWDPALAEAARKHCLRMAAEGPIAHQYDGEPDVGERAGEAGAHFSLVEENVAFAATPAAIHAGWMNSPHHRENLLNPAVDRVGVAVVARVGVLYAVADYARSVPVLTQDQVEASVARLIRATSRVAVMKDAASARAACALDRGLPRSLSGAQPLFVMRWQDADLAHLPQSLADRLVSGDYRSASVGNCPPQAVEGAFTVYRVAVLLYGAPSTKSLQPFY